MSECVAVLSSNKLKIREITKVIESVNWCSVVCENLGQLIETLSHRSIDFYVLDVDDVQGEKLRQYREFYSSFLKYVPNDMRIVIGNEREFINYADFPDVFKEKVACRVLKVKKSKLMSNEELKNLRKQIERYLIEKKFSPKYIGFEYVIRIMSFYLTSGMARVVLSNDIYPKLEKEFHKSNYCIERNIRFFLQSNKFLDEIVLDGNYSTKRILEMLYRDLRKDVFIQKMLSDSDAKDD